MKMKKTLALIMTAAMSFATLTGCSETTNNYMKELAKTSEWEATSSETSGSVKVEAQGLTENISFTSTGYAAGDKAYADIKFTDPSGVFNIPEIKAYTDGSTAYINKSYYEGLYTMMGQSVPEGLKNVNAEYIAIDTGMETDELKTMMTDTDAIVKLSKSIFGDSDIDLPYVQTGREYTMNLDSDQVVDLGVKGINAVSKNLENVNTTFKLGLTSDQIAEVKNQLADESFTQGVTAVKDAIKGSTISVKEVFEDSKYTSAVNVNIQVKDICKVSVTTNSTSTKAEVKDITMPTSVAKFNQEQINQLLASEQQAAVSNTSLAKAIEEVA